MKIFSKVVGEYRPRLNASHSATTEAMRRQKCFTIKFIFTQMLENNGTFHSGLLTHGVMSQWFFFRLKSASTD